MPGSPQTDHSLAWRRGLVTAGGVATTALLLWLPWTDDRPLRLLGVAVGLVPWLVLMDRSEAASLRRRLVERLGTRDIRALGARERLALAECMYRGDTEGAHSLLERTVPAGERRRLDDSPPPASVTPAEVHASSRCLHALLYVVPATFAAGGAAALAWAIWMGTALHVVAAAGMVVAGAAALLASIRRMGRAAPPPFWRVAAERRL